MRVLVTGAAGFIGSHICEQLLAGGHDVVGVDSLDPSAHDGPPGDLDPGVRWEFRDVRDHDLWMGLLPEVDAVCHQAAKVGLGVDLSDAPEYVSNNDLGTATMLAAMHRSGFGGRLVLASSMVVYGEGAYSCARHGTVRPGPRDPADLGAGIFDPRCPLCGGLLDPGTVTEDAPVDPRNVYAATKLHQEHLASAWARETGGAATMLRYHNVYGPRMPRDTPYAGVMSIFASALARGSAPQVFEDGAQRRDFVHVHDVARANLIALEADPVHDGPLNIASGHPCTLLEAARTLAGAHADLTGEVIEPQVVGGYRLGDVRHITADPTAARATIGFTADVHPSDGLATFAGAELREPPKHRP
ncbi:MAG: NAD-dependent epimerase/dehydratase family protein [Microthrixaceae bacterium]|nr:NAD-dependent epimerase/dehydratase family protein [Microthrixaceae bacterium]MCO5316990.1 NAD-dependent epimerase/dehydratase family protein [Microthrixaceae bacterium]